jgi:hypothetical protein
VKRNKKCSTDRNENKEIKETTGERQQKSKKMENLHIK